MIRTNILGMQKKSVGLNACDVLGETRQVAGFYLSSDPMGGFAPLQRGRLAVLSFSLLVLVLFVHLLDKYIGGMNFHLKIF